MTRQENEVSVFFNIPEDLLIRFNEAVKIKSKQIGIELNKKQAYTLAIKEITEIWKKDSH
jgi:hypothetical protein